MNDRTLLRLLRSKDPRGMEAAMDSYGAYVLAVSSAVLRGRLPHEDAEEAAADTFIALWEKADTLREPAALRGWLSRTARNKAISRLRASRETLELEEDILPVTAKDPAEQITDAQRRAALQEALLAMPEPDREIFLRHYNYCQTVAAISEAMNLNPSTVKSRLARGRIKLKKVLLEGGLFDETE